MRQIEEKGVETEDIRQIVARFYTDGGLIAVGDPSTLQKAVDSLVAHLSTCGPKDQHYEDGGYDVCAGPHLDPPHQGGVPSKHVGGEIQYVQVHGV